MKTRINLSLMCLLLLLIPGYLLAQNGSAAPEVIDVTAAYHPDTKTHVFETDTDTIPSGWTTFHFINASPAVHFMILEHLPGDKSKKDVEKEAAPIFQDAMDLLKEGKTQEGYARLGELPAWFSKMTFMGGTGLVMPGQETQVTTFLTPGNYTLECYIKTPDGTFHSMLGMFRDLRVTEEKNNATEPSTADIDIYPTSDDFKIEGNLTPGKHLVAVHFEEDPEGPSAPDVHVVKLDENTDMDKVATWMDWTQPMGFVSDHMGKHPAPANFLGGSQEAPKGARTYFTLDLEPGKYALVSEQPASTPNYKIFEVK
ncbi:MAG: hypothetical protein WBV11_08910 [Salegentibacter sp.]